MFLFTRGFVTVPSGHCGRGRLNNADFLCVLTAPFSALYRPPYSVFLAFHFPAFGIVFSALPLIFGGNGLGFAESDLLPTPRLFSHPLAPLVDCNGRSVRAATPCSLLRAGGLTQSMSARVHFGRPSPCCVSFFGSLFSVSFLFTLDFRQMIAPPRHIPVVVSSFPWRHVVLRLCLS